MAKNVQAQVLGSPVKTGLTVGTVGDLVSQLNLDGSYTAMINGEPADMDDELDDYQFVSLAPAVKGGR